MSPEEQLPPPTPGLPGTVPGPTWVRSSTAQARPGAVPPAAAEPDASLPEAPAPPVAEAPAGAVPVALSPLAPLPTLRSPDGRVVLTGTHLTVLGYTYGLRELERAEVQHVRWVLWLLLGGVGLAAVLIAFLQNWLHTLPAMVGMASTGLLLAYGQRGTNRLRLWLLGRQPAHFALPGELAPWQRLVGELNRRVARAHDHAAAEAAALLAALAAEQATQLAQSEADAFPPPTDETGIGH